MNEILDSEPVYFIGIVENKQSSEIEKKMEWKAVISSKWKILVDKCNRS